MKQDAGQVYKQQRGGLGYYKYVIYGVVLVFLACLPFILRATFITDVLILACIYLITVASFNLLLGYTGLMSFGHAAFYGIGGYASALIVMDFHVPWPVGLVGAMVVCAAASFLLGLPLLRLHHAYFMFATFAASSVIVIILQNWESLTHGVYGVLRIPPMFESLSTRYIFVFVLMVLVIFFIYRLVHSRIGRAFVTIRDNESLAASLGINVARYKLLSFVIAAALCGLAGGLMVHHIGSVYPETMISGMASIYMALYTVIGGPGYILGPPITGFIFTLFPHVFIFLKDYYSLFLALLIIVAILFMPNGLEPIIRRRLAMWRARIRAAKGPLAPGEGR